MFHCRDVARGGRPGSADPLSKKSDPHAHRDRKEKILEKKNRNCVKKIQKLKIDIISLFPQKRRTIRKEKTNMCEKNPRKYYPKLIKYNNFS